LKQYSAAPVQKIIRYVGKHGIVRPRDIEAIGLPRDYLVRLHRQGKLNRTGRGVYTLPNPNVTEHHSYAEVAKRVADATICLLSALAFHEITTQSPASVWIALRKGARTPALASPSLRVVRLSGPSLTEGLENRKIDGVPVRVYSAAKTVADCFKFRNKIGLDVAIEALKDCLRQKKASINEIYRYAKVCRVSNVIRPYMEAL
jgi:predicted transcriptional regulator of viral defense system